MTNAFASAVARRRFRQRSERRHACGSFRRVTALGSIVVVAALLIGPKLFAQAPAADLDRARLADTVEQLAVVVEREYFDAEVAAACGARLRERLKAGRYESIATQAALAERLTAELFGVTNDKHLAVSRRSAGVAESDEGPADSEREDRGRRENFGVQRVEILPGNVGYLNLTSFYRAEEARDAFSSAMGVLRHAEALILDLRENGGGSPDGVAMLASYLFEQPELPLFEIVSRVGAVQRYSTERVPPDHQDAARALYALTSGETFSAGEGLAYILQERGRAQIVGEATAGAANPGRPYPVNSHFEVVVPNGQVVTAIKRSNWEGAGVRPDIQAAGGDALRVAHELALEQLRKRPVANSPE